MIMIVLDQSSLYIDAGLLLMLYCFHSILAIAASKVRVRSEKGILPQDSTKQLIISLRTPSSVRTPPSYP